VRTILGYATSNTLGNVALIVCLNWSSAEETRANSESRSSEDFFTMMSRKLALKVGFFLLFWRTRLHAP